MDKKQNFNVGITINETGEKIQGRFSLEKDGKINCKFNVGRLYGNIRENFLHLALKREGFENLDIDISGIYFRMMKKNSPVVKFNDDYTIEFSTEEDYEMSVDEILESIKDIVP